MPQQIIVKPVSKTKTCSQCPHFNDYSEPNRRGWCELFGQQARKHHQRTNDCDLFADTDPLDAPHPELAIDSTVKVIDADEHHTEWASFIVIGRKYNSELYRSTEAYLSEPSWYYELVGSNYQPNFKSIWIAENDICEANQSHLIRTEEIF
ncbi:hypothetical protein [Pleurocapsa sp. PCC 7319]|uniref:hypothetical protein n=1 Tax=Pleurocapsa sp. PCC 7319 TaxID=118161 RepID=UPI000346163A|nr:hypothetical protein [Pleurocapsa sp. PCC 7319]